MRLFCFTLSLLLTALLPLAACSTDATSERDSDPRFASAEALVEHFNSLNTKMPRDLSALLPLYHLESDFQRRQWEGLNGSNNERRHEIDCLMYAQFGEMLDQFEYEVLACTPAVLTQINEKRAEGVYHDETGVERPLHLIKVGDRWWISGYTLEYTIAPHERAEYEASLDFMLESMRRVGHIGTDFMIPVIDRLRHGEFSSADEVRDAYIAVLMQRTRDMRK